MAKVISVSMTSHTEEIKAELRQKVNAWLEAIGEDAASTAAGVVPVDTGRLKGSISSAVVEQENAVYIGTNVEYAIYHEFGTGKYASDGSGRQRPWMFQDKDGEWHWTAGVPARHFLQFGATAHQEQYKSMLENILKS